MRSVKYRGVKPKTVAKIRKTGYGDQWRSVASKAKQADGRVCVKCGSTTQLESHHIIPKAKGGGDFPANLITLCRRCHSRQPGHGHLR